MASQGFAVMRCEPEPESARTRFVVREMVRTLDEAQTEVARLNEREPTRDVYYFWKAAHPFEVRY